MVHSLHRMYRSPPTFTKNICTGVSVPSFLTSSSIAVNIEVAKKRLIQTHRTIILRDQSIYAPMNGTLTDWPQQVQLHPPGQSLKITALRLIDANDNQLAG